MVSFYVYDLTFLALFCIFVIWFLMKNKKIVSRQGIIFMFRTQYGIKAIKWFSDKFSKSLHFLKYLIVAIGAILMAGML